MNEEPHYAGISSEYKSNLIMQDTLFFSYYR